MLRKKERVFLVTTLTGEPGDTPATGPMLGTPLKGPRTLDTDNDGNAFLVLREGNAIFQLDLGSNSMKKIAGTGNKSFSGDGGSSLFATFNGPKGVAYLRADNSLHVADTENHAIRKIELGTGLIDTVLGTGEEGDGPDCRPYDCQLNRPHGVCVFERVIYVADSENHRIRALTGAVT